MQKILESLEETEKRVYAFPTSQIKLHGEKSSYHEVIHSLAFPECNAALVRIYERLDLGQIMELLDKTEGISEIHREFYRHMILERYNKIIKASYDKLRAEK